MKLDRNEKKKNQMHNGCFALTHLFVICMFHICFNKINNCYKIFFNWNENGIMKNKKQIERSIIIYTFLNYLSN